jgi:hypothetical protein
MKLEILFLGKKLIKNTVGIFIRVAQYVTIQDGYHLGHQHPIKEIHNVPHVLLKSKRILGR